MRSPTSKNKVSETLDSSIRYVRGIGPKRCKALEGLGIRTVPDLLYYFPRDYLDRSRVTKIRGLRQYLYADHDVTVVGRVVAKDVVRGKGGRTRFVLIVQDETALLHCVFFGGIQWFQKMFRVGEILALSDTPTMFQNRIQFVHPDFDRLSVDEEEDGGIDWSSALNTGAIVPQYRSSEELKETVRLDSRGFRRILKSAVTEKISLIPEALSEEIRKREKLLPLAEALRAIHFPNNWQELEQACRRLKFDELFYLQLLLAYRKREVKVEQKGIVFKVESKLARQLVDSLPFKLTRAQIKVVNEIAEDMKSPKPMNRLLQGDVGSGKTIVALIAMLIAVENEYQTAFMAPTEILAEQHYRTIAEFLKRIDVNIRLLIGGQRKRLREDILEDVCRGSAEIVVGTHALIQEKVEFANLGFIVIDEQHRFGVLQRATLREKAVAGNSAKLHPDVLVMTATPIPRTLSLTLYGDLDVSTIDEMPKERKPIQTLLKVDTQRKEVYQFVREEVQKGRQAYIVYPLIEESEKIDLQAATKNYELLRDEVFPDLDVELLHGQMPSDTKDEIMNDFKLSKIDILVATTVIEVGIDVPNATVMVIENAERFGLAQLHQLRGRVGRGSEQSYCILVARHQIFSRGAKPPMTENAKAEEAERRKAEQRLNTILKTSDGFKIAEVDLELRGPGEFFGTKQSGLPELQIANIVTDGDILMAARREAFQLVATDPQLRSPDHQPIREHFIKKYRDQLALVRIG